MTSMPVINGGSSYYAGAGLADAISQIASTAAIAPFIQTTNALASWNTDEPPHPGSNHNLLNNNTVLLDPNTGDMTEMNSLSFTSGNVLPPLPGSLWLNSNDNHLYHGNVDIEAIGGDVTGPMSSTIGEIAIFGDTVGDFIDNSGVIIDTDKNIGNLKSISFEGTIPQPVPGSLWLNSSDDVLYHNAISLENQGNVIGSDGSINESIPIFDGTGGDILKDSEVVLSMKNMGSLNSLKFNALPMIPVAGSLWLDSNDNKLYHGSVSLEDSGGDIFGPNSSVIDNFCSFADTTGKLIKDSGLNAGSFGNVSGPNSSQNLEVPVFMGITGKLLTNSGIISTDLVQGPVSAVADNLCSYNLTTGKLIKDSGISVNNVVQGPISSISGNVSIYNGTSGKLIQDSGILASNIVQGPVSSVADNLSSYNGTTGKLIKDSGISVASVGDVKGPGISVVDNISTFSNTSGKLIKDSGISVNNIVQGPVSSISGNVSTYSGTTGKLIQDSGILASNIVQGPASSISGNLSTYNGTTGKLIQDSGILASNIVQGPVSSISGNVSTYNGTTGKLIQDSGILASNIVQGPASAVNNNLCAFNLTTGKLIKDSGISASGTISGTAVITDIKAANTDGGTFSSGAWRTRTLNNIVTNGNSGASLSANQVTLVAGTYRINGYAPARNVFNHQTRIQNITDGTTTIIGGSQFSQDASGVLGIGGGIATSNSDFDGIFTIASTKVFELQHQCSVTQNTTGFGVATNFGVSCVYSKLVVTRFN